MIQPAPIKLQYQYDGTTKYHVSTINVVLQEIAQALETFFPDSLKHSQDFLANIADKLQRIQESSRLDCQLFEGYSNKKQTEYEAGLKKLKMSEALYEEKRQAIYDTWRFREGVWWAIGYRYET
ncbi:MAG: hypothetical protein ACKN9E_06105, partial [Microcystaceae cyanobacterium]